MQSNENDLSKSTIFVLFENKVSFYSHLSEVKFAEKRNALNFFYINVVPEEADLNLEFMSEKLHLKMQFP